ncbi:hypothetical protein PTH_0670 [Pelotomaculum thermopropionicum SI]|uniref:Uncharacterized protein n=1 Tax=Pelotomaculum thermopropionicum (strain DSM 13744 / JCM 10971 / SI) TaxID=370438 RepID=A5D4J1_PELTS|nr:hypothetical protein PTH_0670 [Pelotomaculum thermopropionicum SI]
MGVLTASLLVVAGVIFNRMNVVFTGMAKSAGGYYFPTVWEFLITIGMWSALILIYCFIAENFPILPKEERKATYAYSSGKRADFITADP